jgi:DNA-binding XRE family transcriptional regulator
LNRRLELGLLQDQVAKIIGVCTDTITNWENGRGEPRIQSYPKVIEFLGYFPFEFDTSILGGRIKKYRYLNGLSQEKFSKELGVNESTVFHYENGKHKPSFSTRQKLKLLLLQKF